MCTGLTCALDTSINVLYVGGCCSFSKPVFLILSMVGQFATQWGLSQVGQYPKAWAPSEHIPQIAFREKGTSFKDFALRK